MEVLIFDAETTPDRKLARPAELVDAKGEPIFPKAALHEIRVIAYTRFVMEDGVPVFKSAQAAGTMESSEAELISAFWNFVGKNRPLLVSWHGRGFDLQVMLHRALHRRVAIPSYFMEQNKYERYRNRYSENWHLDLADTLTEFGAGTRFSLDLASRMVGAPGKIDTSGAAVEQMIAEGKLAQVRDYCVVDTLNLAAVWIRYLLAQGAITREQEDTIKASIIAWIDRQPESMAEIRKFGRLWAAAE